MTSNSGNDDFVCRVGESEYLDNNPDVIHSLDRVFSRRQTLEITYSGRDGQKLVAAVEKVVAAVEKLDAAVKQLVAVVKKLVAAVKKLVAAVEKSVAALSKISRGGRKLVLVVASWSRRSKC